MYLRICNFILQKWKVCIRNQINFFEEKPSMHPHQLCYLETGVVVTNIWTCDVRLLDVPPSRALEMKKKK